MKTEVLCPTCCGKGGQYCEIPISYYDKKLEWESCQLCTGTGYLSSTAYKKYAKAEAKYWSERARRK